MSSGSEAAAPAAEVPKGQLAAGAKGLLWSALRILVPILLALLVSAAALLLLGKDPLQYYGYVVERGLFNRIGLEQTIIRMAPRARSRWSPACWLAPWWAGSGP